MLNFRSLNFALGEDIDMLRATVEQFARDEIAPRAAEIDRTNQFPPDLWQKMGDLGLLGITAEETYGGRQMGTPPQTAPREKVPAAGGAIGLSTARPLVSP